MALKQNKPKYDCSYDFENYRVAKKYRFVVIHPGDLDLNGAIMIRNKTGLKNYLEECALVSRKVLQIFDGFPILESEVSPSAQKANKRRQNFIHQKS